MHPSVLAGKRGVSDKDGAGEGKWSLIAVMRWLGLVGRLVGGAEAVD